MRSDSNFVGYVEQACVRASAYFAPIAQFCVIFNLLLISSDTPIGRLAAAKHRGECAGDALIFQRRRPHFGRDAFAESDVKHEDRGKSERFTLWAQASTDY